MPLLNKAALLSAFLLLAGCAASEEEARGGAEIEQEPLGLFTSLPIYWAEGQDIAAMLESNSQEPSWVRSLLEERYDLTPLDTLEKNAIDGLDRLVIAQPRALAPSENVALDEWVRGGGRALVFADPFLTQHSEFALGDPRRPFDVVLVSPILARWGLTLEFDDMQSHDERVIAGPDGDFPVQLAGRFAPGDGGEDARCSLSSDALVADCAIGAGRVLLVADAAVLDTEIDDAQRRAALSGLLKRLD